MSEATVYEGFSFSLPAVVDDLGQALAQWEAPPTRLRIPRFGAELDRALDQLRASVRNIEAFSDEQRSLSQAAQWLVDNFYVIERLHPVVAQQLPKSATRKLPAWRGDDGKARARLELLAHFYLETCDFDLDIDELVQVLADYQRVHPLLLREIALLAPMLRFLLIRQLQVCAEQIIENHRGAHAADMVADAAAKPPGGVDHDHPSTMGIDLRAVSTVFRHGYLAQIAQRRLYDDPTAVHDEIPESTPDFSDTVNPIERNLLARAMLDVRVRNIFQSIQTIERSDWVDLFTDISLVDRALRKNDAYTRLDSRSRALYREVIENLSGRSGLPEPELAALVVERFGVHVDGSGSVYSGDLGYWLLAEGYAELEDQVGLSPRPLRRLETAFPHARFVAYIALVVSATLGISAFACLEAYASGTLPISAAFFAVVALWPASEVAFSLANYAASRLWRPARLPRLELADGLPHELRTMVVIPTLLIRIDHVENQVAELERHYLSNRDDGFRFALLTDWRDAPTEVLADDQPLLSRARLAMSALNARYPLPPDQDGRRFYVLHRARRWNDHDGIWMGWERKRGKLDEFNRLLLGERGTSYLEDGGELACLPRNVRYVITLDSDTRMPAGAALRLVGTAAHPLNRPHIDTQSGIVSRGYALFQPKISLLLPLEGEHSLFRSVFGRGAGVDPYAAAVSDIYQDIFSEASYTGKGLYDLKAFHSVLTGRVPDNAVLSHDLFESSFARCALVSDVSFFEDTPSHSEVAAARTHRWVRGDWQLLPWILGQRTAPLPALARWKMLDNLRRSILPVAMFALLIGAFLDPQTDPQVWLSLVLASLAMPRLLSWLGAAFTLQPSGVRSNRTLELMRGLGRLVGHVLLELVLLAQSAYVMTDAIIRALWRTYVSRRRMLEWQTAAQTKSAAGGHLRQFNWALGSATVPIIVSCAAILLLNRDAITVVAPLLTGWWLIPVVAAAISYPTTPRRYAPDSEETRSFRRIARLTWRFFEDFVGDADNHLPPDNVQFEPTEIVAHRTSPTNIGLYLVALTRAHELGWIAGNLFVSRLQSTLSSIARLETCSGHLLNWYDTTTLNALEPRYVSFVDSGNLAALLVVVARSCVAARARAAVPIEVLSGPHDTCLAVLATWAKARTVLPAIAVDQAAELESVLIAIEVHLSSRPASPGATGDCLLQARELARLAMHSLRSAELAPASLGTDLIADTDRLCSELDAHINDLLCVCPWAIDIVFANLRHEEPTLFNGTLGALLASTSTLEQAPGILAQVDAALGRALNGRDAAGPTAALLRAARLSCGIAYDASVARLRALETCTAQADKLWRAMNFNFLFDAKRKLFAIGYRVNEHQLDEGRYDLLASEARLGSYLASAKGDVPVDHWISLARPMGLVPAGPVLISWSGSMFEYLMPTLVMKMPADSLLHQACSNAIAEQIRYAQVQGVPWGISESGINVRDREMTYQYGPAGVPTLALKRGMDRQLVVAPYATALAAPLVPQAAVRNFSELNALGALGRHGYYEAVDFTAERLDDNHRCTVVKSHMAHHQAMSLLALTSTFSSQSLVDRFHSEPEMNAFDLVLHEQYAGSVMIARDSVVSSPQPGKVARHAAQPVRHFGNDDRQTPAIHLLSNGRYATAITSTGAGYSACAGIDISRWREDRVIDECGLYIYLRDCDSGALWAATLAPTFSNPDNYSVEFAEARAQFELYQHGIQSTLEVVVAQQEDAEIRTIKLTNQGSAVRRIEIAAMTELVLNHRNADLAHPSFHNLFVTTEYDATLNALLATRRPRASDEPTPTVMLGIITEGITSRPIAFDSDRRKVIGRGRSKRDPLALATTDGRLSGTVGSVLDPVLCLSQTVDLLPGQSTRLSFVLAYGADRDSARQHLQRLHSFTTLQRAISRSWVYAKVQLHYLRVDGDEAVSFQALSAYLMFSDPTFRPGVEFMRGNLLSARALWRYGISGDLPIVLVSVDAPDDLALVAQMVRAQLFWRARAFAVDIVILNDRAASYFDDFQRDIENILRQSGFGPDSSDLNGRLFVLRGDQLPADERRLLMTLCRVLLRGGQGGVAQQLRRRVPRARPAPVLEDSRKRSVVGRAHSNATDTTTLQFFNGYGGFTPDGTEYRIVLPSGRATPSPWVNVIATPHLGTLVTESGASFTWRTNARENQLSPWSNDPISDPSSEILYIQDRRSSAFWSPTAQPRPAPGAVYECAHGAGYSRYSTQVDGIDSELTHFVDWDQPVKLLCVKLDNRNAVRRTLLLSCYVNLCLGDSRSGKVDLLTTWVSDEPSPTLYARNPANADFAHDIAWIRCSHRIHGWTCDRAEFIGLGRSLCAPAALTFERTLRKAAGVGPDPCWVMQVEVILEPGASDTIVFAYGQASTLSAANELAVSAVSDSAATLSKVRHEWDHLLNAVQVETPDTALNFMLNRWLLYQVVSSRCLGRCGFYQAGGAYGFRDQLQDVMALATAWPQYVHDHLLRAAARQFVEGDVQHWWHPSDGKGVRTAFVDDRLWLPYAVAHYVAVTGDDAILDRQIPFLEGPQLALGEESRYFTPTVTAETASLFDHCVRAIDISWSRGVHGLPLMGCGDWNDGMNRVGWKGQGESVWMGWFLKAVLDAFIPLTTRRGRHELVTDWRAHSQQLLDALDDAGWDGAWYRRAYFDDGTPLGSVSNDECRIDSITQSWSVIAGGGNAQRSRAAMNMLDDLLVDREAQLIRLFRPSFDATQRDPGYIKGYVPGVRENGGQYTHAAVWAVMAFAELGDADRAWSLHTMLDPIGKSDSLTRAEQYRVEPYVMPADIYADTPHTGTGGWTWYSGAAGWYYRVGLESMLGIYVRNQRLQLRPCFHDSWDRYYVNLRHGTAHYQVEIRNPDRRSHGELMLTLDGEIVTGGNDIPLHDDGLSHHVVAVLTGNPD